MMDWMLPFVWPTASLVFGLAVGYLVGWNRAAHPGKVEGQLSAAFDKAKDEVKAKL